MTFRHCNFVADVAEGMWQPGATHLVGELDAVLCLSTSKWVHLNFGDAGLRTLCQRAHACLRVGGKFVLEPQPWASYRKNAGLTPTILANYESIRLRPDGFEALLLDEIGFSACEHIAVPYGKQTSEGFARRPLWVLTK